MFYHLEGIVSDIDKNTVVLDCHGIGFAVSCSLNTIAAVEQGKNTKLFISEIVKEDAFELYGFSDKLEKHMFEMLISVSGIGPKASIAILSANTPSSLILAISSGNEKALTVAPGIGKKTAQRVILELKDKISAGTASDISSSIPVQKTAASNNSTVTQAISALNVLGYSDSEVMMILNTIDVSGMTTEQIIKAVLKHMI